MRAALVLNSTAGSLLGRDRAEEEVAHALQEAGLSVTVIPEGAGLVSRMQAAAAAGVEAVIVGGGDGTIACAAQILAGTDIALGILPLGTMNLLAKDLRIPLELPAAIEALGHGEIRVMDVGYVNGQVFLCNSVLGFPTHVAERRERNRSAMGLSGWWRLGMAALKSLYRYPPLRIELDLGRGPERRRSHALAVVNNEYDEAFGQFFTRSRLDSGELVLYLTKGLTFWPLVRIAAGMAMGDWQNDPNLEKHRVKSLSVRSRRRLLRVMNDGEVSLLRPPLRYSIAAGALKVIASRPATVDAAEGAVPQPVS